MPNAKRKNRCTTYCLLLAVSFVIFLSSYRIINAQNISLGISPPLTEIMIQPGKDFTQNYQLANEAAQTVIKARVVTFTSADKYGNVKLLEKYDDSLGDYLSWFKVVEPQLNAKSAFVIAPGATKNVTVKIDVPENASEGDYYVTLLFETDNSALISGETSGVNAKIGTNILLTVSKDGNPERSSEIVNFSVPHFTDSFREINYKVVLANTGSAYFKPIGNITVRPFLGKERVLEIAPQNILASSQREYPCVNDNTLIRCTLNDKFLLGTYIAKLEFQIDGEGETYEATTTTITFPYLFLVAIFISISILFTIKVYKTRK